jgi:peptide/nickel transport system permease protein
MRARSYRAIVWSQLKKRRSAMAALYALAGLLALAVGAPILCSNKPFYWQTPQGWHSPWLASLFDRNFFESNLDIFFNTLLVAGAPLLGAALALKKCRASALKTVHRPALLLLAMAMLAALVWRTGKASIHYPQLQARLLSEGVPVIAIYAPIPYSFRDIDLDDTRAAIGWKHPLGTDSAGRDVFTRLVYGTRISLTVGVFAVLLYVLMGTALGAAAGYFGGRIDLCVQRLIEVVISIPSLFLVLTLAAFIEKRSVFHIMAIIAAVHWTTPARLVRAEFLRLKAMDFVAAAKAAGFGDAYIIFREMLPNALGPVLVTATFGVASAILVESTMSFLGLGDITVPSWGQILSTGRSTGMWALIIAPGAAIFVTVGLLNLLGDGLRDALDPKLRQ